MDGWRNVDSMPMLCPRLEGTLCKYVQDVSIRLLAEGQWEILLTMKSTIGWNAPTALIKKINLTYMETNSTLIDQSPDSQLPALPVKFDPEKDVDNAQK